MNTPPLCSWLTWTRCASACLILLGSVAGCQDSGRPPPLANPVRPVKTFVVSAPAKGSGIELPGRVRVPGPIDLAFEKVSGKIVELPIAGRDGQEVLKGELLAQIDPTGFETALRNAEDSLYEAYSVRDLARAENERMERMKAITPDLVSASMLERTGKGLEQAETRLASLEAEVRKAEDLLERSSLRAPFGGIVTRCLVESFQTVQPGEPILSLQDVSHLEVVVETLEPVMAVGPEAGSVKGHGSHVAPVNDGRGRPDRVPHADPFTGGEGDMGPAAGDFRRSVSATARFPLAPGEAFPLILKHVSPTANPANGSYRIVLEMSKPGVVDLPPGTVGTVKITGEGSGKGAGSVLVPAIAVMTDPDGKDYVWLVDGVELRVHRRDIRIGSLIGPDQIQVLAGLAGGERIVAAGVTRLAEGRRVRLWEDRKAGTTH
jgi:multidrug efflux system membrane fusion protein